MKFLITAKLIQNTIPICVGSSILALISIILGIWLKILFGDFFVTGCGL